MSLLHWCYLLLPRFNLPGEAFNSTGSCFGRICADTLVSNFGIIEASKSELLIEALVLLVDNVPTAVFELVAGSLPALAVRACWLRMAASVSNNWAIVSVPFLEAP